MGSIVWLIDTIIGLIIFLVIVQFVMSLLIQFEILNRRQPLVMQIYYGVSQLLDPMLAPVRRILPSTGMLDFSPLVLILALQFLRVVITNNF